MKQQTGMSRLDRSPEDDDALREATELVRYQDFPTFRKEYYSETLLLQWQTHVRRARTYLDDLDRLEETGRVLLERTYRNHVDLVDDGQLCHWIHLLQS